MKWTPQLIDSMYYKVMDKLGNEIKYVVEADTDMGTIMRVVVDESANSVYRSMGLGMVYHKSFCKYFEIVDTRSGDVLDVYDVDNPVTATSPVDLSQPGKANTRALAMEED